MGNTEFEDALQRLDRLTLEEAYLAAGELLRVFHNVESDVSRVNKAFKVSTVRFKTSTRGLRDGSKYRQEGASGRRYVSRCR